MLHSEILASLNFKNNKILSPGLLEKYQIKFGMHGYSKIQGTRSKKDGELRGKSVPYFQQESGSCPLDWRIPVHPNVDLVFFQQS